MDKKNLKKKYDNNGSIASKGKVRNNLDYELDTFLHFENKEFNKNYIKSFSVDDFDISFVRGLSLEDGAQLFLNTLLKLSQIIIFIF